MATAPDKMLGMSDEEFSNLNSPGDATAVTAPEAAGEGEAASGAGEPTPGTASEAGAEGTNAGETDKEGNAEGAAGAEGEGTKTEGEAGAEAGKEAGADPAGSTAAKTSEEIAAAETAKAAEGEAKPGETATDDKSAEGGAASSVVELSVEQKVSAFDQIMKPFKANGKMIELRSPEEAVALMQMGANYTKRMQDIQPHRKMLMMLQSNNLLDEGKLSFLIDLDKKDPEAIKKLLKDSGVDPLEIDTSGDPAYREGSHRISDEEVGFRTALEELGSTPEGQGTLTEINTGWDQASKEVLWKSPEIMSVIHQQRENGVYDIIKAEVDRRITLGAVPANTPFLQAYKTVGDEMAQAALGGGNGGKQPGASTAAAEPTVVATRTETPKSKVANGDKAAAASPTRASPSAAAGEKQNVLAMSDEAFLKQMENRL